MRKMLMALAATAALGTAGFNGPATAQTASVNDLVTAVQSGAVKSDFVQYRHHYRGGPRYVERHYYGRPYYGARRYGYYPRGYYHHNNGGALAAGALGLATGAIIGGALSQSQAAPVYQGNAYCAQRFKSYDPASGTYLGYDGARHPCP